MVKLSGDCLAYFREEVRQYKTMLNGVLSVDYRSFVIKKLQFYEHIIDLLEKECMGD